MVEHMKLPSLVLAMLLSIVVAGLSALELSAQRGAAPADANAGQLQVAAVVGCLAADGQNWVLTNATQPIMVPTADGKVSTGSAVTAERAKSEPAGKERYRLMNMLSEFGVPNYKGQRVLVKGLVLGTGKDRRVNLVAFEPIAPTCQ